MISKYLPLLLILLISPIIFFFATPAYAHSFDYCMEILQNSASLTVNGTEKFKLKRYPEYAEIAKDCDKELKEAGLITLTQVENNTTIASAVLNGILLEEDLDEAKRKQKEDQVKQKDEDLKKIRQDICSKRKKEDAYACVGV